MKWNGGIKDIGCSQSEGCSSTDGIVADAFYNPTEDAAAFSWVAKDKFLEEPYICMSKCPRYYTWFPSEGKCFKIVNQDETSQVTIGDAMLQCSLDGARLVPFETCDKMKAFLEELYILKEITNQTFFIGNFAFKDSAESSYRNWEKDTVINS